MTEHRFFVPPERITEAGVRFYPDTSHQIARVLRLQPGDEVRVFDGSGLEHVVRLTAIGREASATILRSFRTETEPDIVVSLYQGLLKGKKLELVLQKCTEIGVSRFIPLQTQRAVAGEPSASRLERFSEIVREAAEQSGRTVVPRVEAWQSLDDALTSAVSRGRVLFLWEGERLSAMPPASAHRATSEVSLFIGSEGGFGEAEAASARASGAKIVSLGPRILRAETAAIVASALVLQGH